MGVIFSKLGVSQIWVQLKRLLDIGYTHREQTVQRMAQLMAEHDQLMAEYERQMAEHERRMAQLSADHERRMAQQRIDHEHEINLIRYERIQAERASMLACTRYSCRVEAYETVW
jgi:hypothetical protein